MLKSATFRFHESLNDFLPDEQKKSWISYSFYVSPSIKNVIEALGAPHVEVDVILVNNASVDFSYLLQNNDEVEVYPILQNSIFPKSYSLGKDHVPDKFILDVHLGKLAKALRMLGFDTVYENDLQDETIIQLAIADNRIVLTRDLLLLKHGSLNHGLWMRSQHLEEQLKEVISYFKLETKFKPFARCLECNGMIKKIEKEVVLNQLPPRTEHYFNEFFQCSACKRVYWKGSHYDRMKRFIDQIRRFASD